MKLAIISDEVSQDWERVLAFAREFDLDGIEVRSVGNQPPHESSDEEVEMIARTAKEAGLEICGVASPVFKCDVHNEAEVEEHVQILRRCVELATKWNAPLIRVFTGWRVENPQAEYPHVAKLFRDKLLPQVENTPIILGVENEYSTNVASGEEVAAFLKAVDSPKVTLVWDPCNILYMPEMRDSLQVDYPLVRGKVGHFHVKDAARVVDEVTEQISESVAVGDGQVQIREHLQAVRADGFDGWVSLETHWRMSKVLSEKEANLPMGQSFSADAEPASRECMTRLKSWIKELA